MKDFIERPDEADMIRNLKANEQYALRTIYNAYAAEMFTRISYLIKENDLAKDLLQETFIKLWERRAAIDIKSSLKAYLLHIAQNLVFDYYRKLARQKELKPLAFETPVPANALEDELELTGRLDKLHHIIDLLPPQRKRIFVMCKLEGKTYQEVSAVLHISVSTINDHIVKATRFLKDNYPF